MWLAPAPNMCQLFLGACRPPKMYVWGPAGPQKCYFGGPAAGPRFVMLVSLWLFPVKLSVALEICKKPH